MVNNISEMTTKNIPSIFSFEDETYKSVFYLEKNNKRIAEGGLRFKGLFKNNEKKPLVSIVTIVFNGEKHIEETIKSVLNQTYDNVEYIIIDGGSTDNTLNIIKKYENHIDYFVSEGDSGISDAFNKGIICSTGDLIGLINADDFYEHEAISHIVNSYEVKNNGNDVYYGYTKKITLDGLVKLKKNSSFGWFVSVPFSHCSSFITRGYYKKFGLYNTSYKIAMDVELLMRGLNKVKYKKIPHFIATQRDGGVSDVSRIDGYKEYRSISISHYGVFLSYLGYYIKLLISLKNKVFKL